MFFNIDKYENFVHYISFFEISISKRVYYDPFGELEVCISVIGLNYYLDIIDVE